ncbi:hypothetical protein Bbelb_020500 [Branchiostoma belcheri]|nr:hypothetical protein Bbelb_020500 [Branchiostoma belcheri]
MAMYTIGQVLEDMRIPQRVVKLDGDYEEEQDRGRRRGARPRAGPECGEHDIGRELQMAKVALGVEARVVPRGEAVLIPWVKQQGTWQDMVRGMLRGYCS